MREIKFRAWYVAKQQMFSAEELGRDQLTLSADGRGFVNVSGRSFSESQFFRDKMIPEQYTGLHDKNGKEIYEGDRYKLPSGRVVPIVFRDGGFGYVVSDDEFISFAGHHHLREILEGEVVGTIHDKETNVTPRPA